MADFPTYAYQDDKIAAFDGEHVIASGTDFAKVSETAEQYFGELRSNREHKARAEATHIITPNGERGTILGRTASLWSDQITVRFDNGQIRHYDTFVTDGLRYTSAEDPAAKNPMEYFQARLDEMPDPTREGLTARLNDLDSIRNGAGNLITAGVSNTDAQRLHQIALAAETEKREVVDALAHLEAVDSAIEMPKQAYTAVEQAGVGPYAKSNWLEVVAQDMIAEAEAEDLDKLAAEGPTTFVSALDDAVVAHAGITREMAQEFIHSKTAAFQGEAVEAYRESFVAATELARRREETYRREAARTETTTREASIADVPDEALFM
jgi:hypothetical protein